jgi:hypothetical protein
VTVDAPRNDAPRRSGRGFQAIDNTRNLLHGRRDSSGRTPSRRLPPIDFAALNRLALPHLPALLNRWLPDGSSRGREYVARNPKREDRHAGSFTINTATGAWADFADAKARGGDVISLAAYLYDLTNGQAAQRLAQAIGCEVPHV